ncbi:MAG: FAD-dependent oxidoreductase [Solirubrobacterales bacterium]|nr:FAD-dependent oxidoreductase [Solirubrobacterales bacterium]
MREVEAGTVARLVFAVPSGVTWPLPLYELALLSSLYVARHGVKTQVTLVSPERAPLDVFGTEASRLVSDLLARREVRFVGSCTASSFSRDGSLALGFDGEIEADRVVALPQLRANRVTGVPADRWGFVGTDTSGRVEGLTDVYAAGDMTTSPIKQGGLATQQADRVAETIAATVGGQPQGAGDAIVLAARLLGGEHPMFLCVELDTNGNPVTATLVHSESDQLVGRSKVLGRYLTPYLEERDRLALSSARCAG